MRRFTYQLEKYRGTNSRFICPDCGRKEFTRYVNEFGEHLSADVGKCSRNDKCGYHKPPREFFAANPHLSASRQRQGKARTNKPPGSFAPKTMIRTVTPTAGQTAIETLDSIDDGKFINDSWQNYEQNSFVKFLLSVFEWEVVQSLIKTFCFGTDGAKVIFWQFDKEFKTRTGKIMLYDERNGKRKPLKTWIDKQTGEPQMQKISWIHSELKKQGKLSNDFDLSQCFFGEHLLTSNSHIKSVALVESEKTAVICQAFWQNIIFLACGGVNNLSLERMKILRDKRILLFPDAGCFDLWNKKADEFIRKGFNVKVSQLVETNATQEEREDGFDLADYLIRERFAEREFARAEREAIQDSG